MPMAVRTIEKAILNTTQLRTANEDGTKSTTIGKLTIETTVFTQKPGDSRFQTWWFFKFRFQNLVIQVFI